MQILATHPPRGAEVAVVDVDLGDGVRLFGVRLMRVPDGSHRAYAKNVTFSPAAIEEIAKLARGRLPDARHH
jgi:hypothetical protein